MPAMTICSSSSPVPPDAPAAPRICPSADLINTAPVCGMNFCWATAATAPKKAGRSLARWVSTRELAPMPTAAADLPSAMSSRSAEAPSSRAEATTWAAASTTTTPMGLKPCSRALARAACSRVWAWERVKVLIGFLV